MMVAGEGWCGTKRKDRVGRRPLVAGRKKGEKKRGIATASRDLWLFLVFSV